MLIVGALELALFLFISKKFTKFIDEHNKCVIKAVINRTFLRVSWALGFIIIFSLLVMNIID